MVRPLRPHLEWLFGRDGRGGHLERQPVAFGVGADPAFVLALPCDPNDPRVLDGPNGDDAVTVWVYTRQCYECGLVEEWQ